MVWNPTKSQIHIFIQVNAKLSVTYIGHLIYGYLMLKGIWQKYPFRNPLSESSQNPRSTYLFRVGGKLSVIYIIRLIIVSWVSKYLWQIFLWKFSVWKPSRQFLRYMNSDGNICHMHFTIKKGVINRKISMTDNFSYTWINMWNSYFAGFVEKTFRMKISVMLISSFRRV